MIEKVLNGSALSPMTAEAAEGDGAASRSYKYQHTAAMMAQTAFLFGVIPGN